MPIGNSVYQPTTVSYENRPGSLLSQSTASSPLQLLRKPIPQIIVLVFGVFSIALGTFLYSQTLCVCVSVCVLIDFHYRSIEHLDTHTPASMNYFDNSIFVFFSFNSPLLLYYCSAGSAMIVNAGTDYKDAEAQKNDVPISDTETTEAIDIGLIVGGILITAFGFVLLGVYVKFAEWRRNCACPCRLSKKQGLARTLQGGNGGAQILPLNPSTDPLVSHTQYAPVSELPRPEDEECRTLMNDNKDW